MASFTQSYDNSASSSLDASNEIEITSSVLQNVSHSVTSGGGVGTFINYNLSASRDGMIFDGLVEVPDVHLTSSDWTIEFWLSGSDLTGNAEGLISQNETSNNPRQLELRFSNPSGDTVQFLMIINANVKNTQVGDLTNWRSWNHIAMVSSGTIIACMASGSRRVHGLAESVPATTSSLRFGIHNAWQFVDGAHFRIDELRISKTARYDTSIDSYTIPTASFNNDHDLDSDVLGYYSFNASGSQTGDGTNGIIFNSASTAILPDATWSSSNATIGPYFSQSGVSPFDNEDPPLENLTGSGTGAPVTTSMGFTPGEYSASSEISLTLDRFTILTSMSIDAGTDNTGAFDDTLQMRLSTDEIEWWFITTGSIWTSSLTQVTKSKPSEITGSIESFLQAVFDSGSNNCTNKLFVEPTILSVDTSSRISIDDLFFEFVTASRGATITGGTGVGRDIWLENFARAKKGIAQSR